MSKALLRACGFVFLVITVGLVSVQAFDRDGHDGRDATLAITMTNDAAANAIRVYDTETQHLLQTLSTRGQGGVSGNARGIRADGDDRVAVVNNGSNTVAVFRRQGNHLGFEQILATTSAPVSIDFGNDHLYVAGSTTVDSFPLRHGRVEARDGTTVLQLVNGETPPAGSTAQVGVLNGRTLLVTLKTDPDPGTVDIIRLDEDGAVRNTAAPQAVSAPAGTLTPFGFSVYPDGTALITLAHSSQDGLFRGGEFTEVIEAGQMAPCWMTRVGKYVFTANTGSKTISRLAGTGNHVFVDDPVAAPIATGGAPSDIDAAGGVLGVIDSGGGESHLSLFTYNRFGELTPRAGAIALGSSANGLAIVPAADRGDR
jgi:hypothetical protein